MSDWAAKVQARGGDMGELIAGRALAEWKEFARRDDCLDRMVPSDLRLILAALEPAPDLAELVEALRFYADHSYNGYDVNIGDYGLSMQTGEIIKDAGDRARAALAKIKEPQHG